MPDSEGNITPRDREFIAKGNDLWKKYIAKEINQTEYCQAMAALYKSRYDEAKHD